MVGLICDMSAPLSRFMSSIRSPLRLFACLSMPQASSYTAFPFLGEAGISAVSVGVIFCFVATCRTSVSGMVLPRRAAARMGHDRCEKNRGAIGGCSPGKTTGRPTADTSHAFVHLWQRDNRVLFTRIFQAGCRRAKQ